jgi:hypothetical protein
MCQTPALDDTEKIRPQHRLEWANKNRMETQAADFQYVDFTGKTGSLYQITTDIILLFFGDPACPSCKSHIESLRNSAVINRLISERRMTILSMYTEQDPDEWKANYADYPSNWLNGYDKLLAIRDKYDLRASPTMYLLDKNKIVILKDVSLAHVDGYLNYMLQQQ